MDLYVEGELVSQLILYTILFNIHCSPVEGAGSANVISEKKISYSLKASTRNVVLESSLTLNVSFKQNYHPLEGDTSC
jgi:hypothetical protein